MMVALQDHCRGKFFETIVIHESDLSWPMLVKERSPAKKKKGLLTPPPLPNYWGAKETLHFTLDCQNIYIYINE